VENVTCSFTRLRINLIQSLQSLRLGPQLVFLVDALFLAYGPTFEIERFDGKQYFYGTFGL